MNDNKYKEYLNKIDEYYKDNPDTTIKELEKATNNIEYVILMKNSGINSSKFLGDKSVQMYIAAFVIIILAIGLLGIRNNSFDGAYYFGSIFYITGLLVGLNAKGVGLIALLTHGGTGFGLMIGPTIRNIIESPVMSDLANNNIISLLVIAFIAIVVAIIMTIFYNLSEKFKSKKYSLPVILLLYMIGIVIIKVIPVIYNIRIDNLF